MRECVCLDPTATSNGPVLEAFFEALGPYRSRGEKVVARNCGVSSVPTGAGATYSMQGYLKALKELQDQFGQSFLQRVGSLIFSKALFPPGIKGIEGAMHSIDVAYNMNSTGKIGSYRFTATGSRGVMVCDNPFPCAFDFGLLLSVAARFAPSAKVTHLDPECCRHTDGESCSYSVEW